MEQRIYDEVMRRFDILESQGLADEVREAFKNGTVCYTEKGRFPWGQEIGINWPISREPRFERIIQEAQADGWIPFYAIHARYQEIGDTLSVFVISGDEADSEAWDEDRDALKDRYAMTYTQNFTYGFSECGDIAYDILSGGAVRTA